MTTCMLGWSDPDHNKAGRCCCNCQYHLIDNFHCTTIDRVQHAIDTDLPAIKGCVCSIQKGWICSPPEDAVAYSGWAEHGMCEMHQFKKDKK